MNRGRALREDDGFSLAEVVVSMSIMSVVMVVVIAAIAQIYAVSTRVDTTSYDRDQLTIAFRRLDKEIRYATWLSAPGLVGTSYYFEYAVPGATKNCRELKYSGGVLTSYSWTLPGTTPAEPQVLSNNLAMVNATTPPFTVYAAGSTPYASAAAGTAGVGKNFSPEHAMLRLQFSVVTGTTTVPFDTVFTAENTTRLTAAVNDCSGGRPAS